MKVLFLDIDGVVNNKRTKENFKGFMAIDPAMAALVQRIVRNTGCEIVLSSSWRLFQNGRDEIERKICKFADITPILHAPRGYEIKVWLTRHPEIEHYAILDDAEMPKASFPSSGRISSKRHGKVVSLRISFSPWRSI